MCLTGCKSPSDPKTDESTAGEAVAACKTCVVTISPKPLAICGKTTKTFTATCDKSGGTFTWSIDDNAIATIKPNGASVDVTGASKGKTKVKVTYQGGGCTCIDEAAVTVCIPTQGRHYANAKKSVRKAIGVKAKIKTRYGKVACEDEGCTDSGYHVVYVNITRTTAAGDMHWAQSGYGRERTSGSASVKKYRYAEMNGTDYKVKYDTGNPPAEGSLHTYECLLDKATGNWSFSQDGTVWQNFANDAWKNNMGDLVQWTGEIFNKEDDMPGTAGDKCTFTECKIRVDGDAAFKDANIQRGEVGTPSTPGAHDPAEWGEEWVSGTAINIWDKDPLP